MAILYVFKVNDPNNAGGFPPSVVSSSWFAGLTSYMNSNEIAASQNSNVLLFDDETALNSFLNSYRLTDSALLADIASWKSAHGVSYSNQYFTLTNAGIAPTPLVS